MFLQYLNSVKLPALLLVLHGFSASVLSANNNEADTEKLIQLISNTNVLHCSFQQSSKDKDEHALQNFKGKIAYQRPHKFYWFAGEPLLQTLVSDGKTIWHLDEDLEQVVIQSYQEQADSALLLSVLEAPNTLFKTYQLSSVEDGNKKSLDTVRYQLSPKVADAPLQSLNLTFNKQQLTAFSFVDSLQQTTRIMLENCDTKAALPAFSLSIPEGFDVINE